MQSLFILLSLIFAHIASAISEAENDLVTSLPNTTFQVHFKQYSGYLDGDAFGNSKLFYWLVESQNNAEKDPLILWLNGGPGCSSLLGAFAELGPFYVNSDAKSLKENPYAWNKNASVIFLETPPEVGFSLQADQNESKGYNDDEVAEINYNALEDFFSRRHPRYANRTFFIMGESYAGVYLPALALRLIRGINENNFSNPNFQGIAIGNGLLNIAKQMNSLLPWSYYHGLIGIEDWEQIKDACCEGTDVESCDFFQHIDLPFKKTNSSICTDLMNSFLNFDREDGAYNNYISCYCGYSPSNYSMATNYDSTDNQNGYPCWNVDALKGYLNLREVMEALHVSETFMLLNGEWKTCNDNTSEKYEWKMDTSEMFEAILDEVKIEDFRILIFNGDVDRVCNFVGAAWFLHDLQKRLNLSSQKRSNWYFRGTTAGYFQRYSDNKTNIDVLTVKGAGHFVPNDRPGPALQMVNNFLLNKENYSSAIDFDPLLKLRRLYKQQRQRYFSLV